MVVMERKVSCKVVGFYKRSVIAPGNQATHQTFSDSDHLTNLTCRCSNSALTLLHVLIVSNCVVEEW